MSKYSRRKTKSFSSYFSFSTSHTTISAVLHTAVSYFLILRYAAASSFQPFHRVTSFLTYCQIHHIQRLKIFFRTSDCKGNLTRDTYSILHCRILFFIISTRILGTTASDDFLQQALLHGFLHTAMFVRPSQIRALTFHLMPASFTSPCLSE